MTIGKLIKRTRLQSNLSQKELAEKLGVSASMIGQYESDCRRPKLDTLQRIANALGVPLAYLLEESDINVRSIELFSNIGGTAENIVAGMRLDKPSFALLTAFSQLNPEGQTKAVERVEELTEIPKYQKKPPQD